MKDQAGKCRQKNRGKRRKILTAALLNLVLIICMLQPLNIWQAFGKEKPAGAVWELERHTSSNKLQNEQLQTEQLQNEQLQNKKLQTEQFRKEQQSTQPLALYAKSAALMDAETGRLLYGKEPNMELPMASTTKIMTLLITLENADLKSEVTFSKRAAAMPKVKLNAKAGETFYLMDLCYSLMLESHNDVAVAIAEQVGGSVEGFAELMNDKARQLGMNHTNFVTPNGLDAKEHYSSARDLCTLASYAIKNEQFLSIIQTPSHTFKEIKTGKTYSVNNKDAFLHMYDGAIGIKTGFTGNAGYCFVGAVKRGDRTLVSAVLASGWPPDKTRKWTDTKKLMDYGSSHFTKKTVGTEEIKLPYIRVLNGRENRVSLKTDRRPITLLLGEEENVSIRCRVLQALEAPVSQNQDVGVVEYVLDGEVLAKFPVYTAETVKDRDFPYWFEKILNSFLSFLLR